MKCCMRCTTKRHPGCHSSCKNCEDELAEDRAKKERIRKAKDFAKEPATRTARRYEGLRRKYAK